MAVQKTRVEYEPVAKGSAAVRKKSIVKVTTTDPSGKVTVTRRRHGGGVVTAKDVQADEARRQAEQQAAQQATIAEQKTMVSAQLTAAEQGLKRGSVVKRIATSRTGRIVGAEISGIPLEDQQQQKTPAGTISTKKPESFPDEPRRRSLLGEVAGKKEAELYKIVDGKRVKVEEERRVRKEIPMPDKQNIFQEGRAAVQPVTRQKIKIARAERAGRTAEAFALGIPLGPVGVGEYALKHPVKFVAEATFFALAPAAVSAVYVGAKLIPAVAKQETYVTPSGVGKAVGAAATYGIIIGGVRGAAKPVVKKITTTAKGVRMAVSKKAFYQKITEKGWQYREVAPSQAGQRTLYGDIVSPEKIRFKRYDPFVQSKSYLKPKKMVGLKPEKTRAELEVLRTKPFKSTYTRGAAKTSSKVIAYDIWQKKFFEVKSAKQVRYDAGRYLVETINPKDKPVMIEGRLFIKTSVSTRAAFSGKVFVKPDFSLKDLSKQAKLPIQKVGKPSGFEWLRDKPISEIKTDYPAPKQYTGKPSVSISGSELQKLFDFKARQQAQIVQTDIGVTTQPAYVITHSSGAIRPPLVKQPSSSTIFFPSMVLKPPTLKLSSDTAVSPLSAVSDQIPIRRLSQRLKQGHVARSLQAVRQIQAIKTIRHTKTLGATTGQVQADRLFQAVRPVQATMMKQRTGTIQQTKTFQVEKPITTSTVQRARQSLKLIPPNVPTPFSNASVGRKGGLFPTATNVRRVKQPKTYTPTGYAALGKITGKPTTVGIATGLGVRPIIKESKKKRRGLFGTTKRRIKL